MSETNKAVFRSRGDGPTEHEVAGQFKMLPADQGTVILENPGALYIRTDLVERQLDGSVARIFVYMGIGKH